MATYRWANGSRCSLGAEIVGAALDHIAQEAPGVTPATVVDHARPPTAALHGAFEWDDAVAAEAHRQNQARYLLRNIVVVLDDKREVRAYVNVHVSVAEDAPREQMYVRTLAAMEQPDLRQQILEQAERDIESFQRRYQEYMDIVPVMAAFRQAKELAIGVS